MIEFQFYKLPLHGFLNIGGVFTLLRHLVVVWGKKGEREELNRWWGLYRVAKVRINCSCHALRGYSRYPWNLELWMLMVWWSSGSGLLRVSYSLCWDRFFTRTHSTCGIFYVVLDLLFGGFFLIGANNDIGRLLWFFLDLSFGNFGFSF